MVGEAVTRRLATREVQDVAEEFVDLVSGENLAGLAFVSIATASGVALAQQLVDLVIPRLPNDLRLRKDPQRARDFFTAGALEALWGGLVGLAAVKFIGTRRPFLFATAVGLSIGAFAIAGANFIEWGQRVLGMATAQLSDADVLEQTPPAANQPAVETTAAGGAAQPAATDGGTDVTAIDSHQDARAGRGLTEPVAA